MRQSRRWADMTARRMFYGLILTQAFLNWLISGTVPAFYFLIWVTVFPLVSLILSLAAMHSFRLGLRGLRQCRMGQACQIVLVGRSAWPMPPFRGRVRLTDCLTGRKIWYDPLAGLPTAHCGAYRAQIHRGRVCDYLGLFAFPVKGGQQFSFTVLPQERAIEELPDFSAPRVFHWQPGHSPEPYELRPYRTGDDPKNLHWKLSFKAGLPIIREGQQMLSSVLTVEAVSRGSREELDRIFGRLLWLGKFLLEKKIPFRLRVLTGEGVQVMQAEGEEALIANISSLMAQPCAPEAGCLPTGGGMWRYAVTGGGDG